MSISSKAGLMAVVFALDDTERVRGSKTVQVHSHCQTVSSAAFQNALGDDVYKAHTHTHTRGWIYILYMIEDVHRGCGMCVSLP